MKMVSVDVIGGKAAKEKEAGTEGGRRACLCSIMGGVDERNDLR